MKQARYPEVIIVAGLTAIAAAVILTALSIIHIAARIAEVL
jgi:hypothetical protein